MKLKTVLFVAALPYELNQIKSGVGNYKTIYNLKNHLDNLENKPDFIINLGVCGKSKNANTNDFIQVYRIKSASNNKESLCPIYIDFLEKQSILSSEKIITSEQELLGEDYVDMESYGIDLVATEEKIPYIIIKKPFDVVSNNSKKIYLDDLKTALNNFNYSSLLEKINTFLEQNYNKKLDNMKLELYKICKIYNLTFSEKEIWKKNYNKFIALKLDYDLFLNNFLENSKSSGNGKLDKKEFIKKFSEQK